MDTQTQAPSWLMRPLPVNAEADPKLNDRLVKLALKLPDSLFEMHKALDKVRTFREYDEAANVASGLVWQQVERFYTANAVAVREQLLHFAAEHMVEQALARICRRLVKDPSVRVRLKARKMIDRAKIREVALPVKPTDDWDQRGWLAGVTGEPMSRHKQGKRVQTQHGVPVLSKLADLRKLLDIRSPEQLGYLLLATDRDNGPYTKFTIPKRDGSEREICAPKKQLKWVQRLILDKILAPVVAHDAAHGFIPGRSTVTNAEKHTGALLLLKFDLSDFFPTIHYYRVVGLFTSMGYTVGDGRFHNDDDAPQVAPTLARLCCYTPDPQAWGNAILPQGAPTSPAISNLVCRRLDARLDGLARRNKGTYTRYADDLTFSFKDKTLELGRFRWWVDQICHQEGFFVNQAKFRVIRASQRQVVTGIVVNDELHIPRDARRRFRAILHNCRTHGVASQARGHARFAEYLRGFASYVHMVQPEEGVELLRQVEELLGPESEE
jgi:retron-type reverse transcriptase